MSTRFSRTPMLDLRFTSDRSDCITRSFKADSSRRCYASRRRSLAPRRTKADSEVQTIVSGLSSDLTPDFCPFRATSNLLAIHAALFAVIAIGPSRSALWCWTESERGFTMRRRLNRCCFSSVLKIWDSFALIMQCYKYIWLFKTVDIRAGDFESSISPKFLKIEIFY